MNLLVIEDDRKLNRMLCEILEKEGYTVKACTDGEEGAYYLQQNAYDLALVDWMLPGESGPDILRESRRKGIMTPVVMLTALDGEAQQLRGFGLNIDDYVTKPFSMPILLEKLRVILRRAGGGESDSRLRYRDLVVDLDTREAVLAGRPLDLTAREFELLHTFLAAPGRVFTREMLLSRLWGYDFFGDERVVDSHIKNLRHKLGRDYIETVRGVGYRAAKETR